jgi:hypothetical protein
MANSLAIPKVVRLLKSPLKEEVVAAKKTRGSYERMLHSWRFPLRSEIVFEAALKVPNRYSLCLAAARATRRLHVPSTRTQDTMNQVLSDISSGRYGSVIETPEVRSPAPPDSDLIAL